MTSLRQQIEMDALVDQLMTSAFDRQRDPRSEAYKVGARALLMRRFTNEPLHLPYMPGSAEFDAYQLGLDEGRAIWSTHQKAAQ